MFKAFEDLKPENVFLSATGYVKLVEFSLAKVVNGRTGATELPTPQLATQKRWKFLVWAETPWTFLVKLLFFLGGNRIRMERGGNTFHIKWRAAP